MDDRRAPGGAEEVSVNLGRHVTLLSSVITKGLAREVASHALHQQEADLLEICFERGEECTATQLAEFLPVDPARISRLVTRLVDLGLLSRRRLRSDRRVVMLRLTDEGAELAAQILQSTERYSARLTEGISQDDMRVFESVASRIVANHTAMRQPD